MNKKYNDFENRKRNKQNGKKDFSKANLKKMDKNFKQKNIKLKNVYAGKNKNWKGKINSNTIYSTDKNNSRQSSNDRRNNDRGNYNEYNKKEIYDLDEILKDYSDNKITLKKPDETFILHLCKLYNISELWVLLKKGMEHIVSKYVIKKKKKNLQYDNINFYIKKLQKRKKKIYKNYIENEDMINNTKEDNEENDDDEKTKDDLPNGDKFNDTNMTSFSQKLLFFDIEDALFNIDNDQISVNKKAWKKKIKDLLKKKTQSLEISKDDSEDDNDNLEKTKKNKEYSISYSDIPIYLRQIYDIENKFSNNSGENIEQVNIKEIAKQKVNMSNIYKLLYDIGLTMMYHNFNVYIEKHAEDEEQLHLEIIHNKNNIFSDRINNMVVLIKKKPLIYIMYAKVLIDSYKKKDNLFLKKTILECLKHIFLFVLHNDNLLTFEENDQNVLNYILNIFFNRFNFKDYNVSSFYFFFNSLIYIYAFENFTKKLFIQYNFILKNAVYSMIPSLFFLSANNINEFCLKKKENRYTNLNVLLEAYMTQTKGNPILLKFIKHFIQTDGFRDYIIFYFFEKILSNIAYCVNIIVSALREKQNMDKVVDSFKNEVININRCLYVIYKVKCQTMNDITEHIIYFSTYIFDLFSLNIYELYEKRNILLTSWSIEKMKYMKNIQETDKNNNENNNGNDNVKLNGGENGHIHTNNIDTTNYTHKDHDHNSNINKESQMMIKTNGDVSNNNLNTNEYSDPKLNENQTTENKPENEQAEKEYKDDKDEKKKKKKIAEINIFHKYCLYGYLSKKIIKLLSSILVKNIYFIICNKSAPTKNEENDIEENKSQDKKYLNSLNFISILKVIKSVDSYKIKINFLIVMFLLLYCSQQLDDNAYCFFYSILKDINYYECYHTYNFYSLMTVLILTDPNLIRNLSFIKRIFQFSIHSKETWTYIYSLNMIKYLVFKKNILMKFLFNNENKLCDDNINYVKNMHMLKFNKYHKNNEVYKVDDKIFIYNKSVNNPLDSNSVLTHLYEFYNFTSMLNNNFDNLLLEFRNINIFNNMSIFKSKPNKNDKANNNSAQVIHNNGNADKENSTSIGGEAYNYNNQTSEEQSDEKRGDGNMDDNSINGAVSTIVTNGDGKEDSQVDDIIINIKNKHSKEYNMAENYKIEHTNNNTSENKFQTPLNKTRYELQKGNNMNYVTHKTSYSTHIVINMMEKLALNYKTAMDQLSMNSIFNNFLHDCCINESIQNNDGTINHGKLKLYNNAYQKYYYDILHLYNNSSFKKFKDKYKTKRKKQKDNEHRDDDSTSSIDEEQEEDRFLDEYIAKNFDLDNNLNEYADNEDGDDLFLNINNKNKSKKAFKDKSATNKKRNLTSVSSNKKKSQKKRHKSEQLSDDNILEFSDFVKSKKNKNRKKN
ncbi:large ribosomal subunit nuclear export factor, putative [Plasmodium chabaudi chabaudi]|uniref:Large ribosomal subunit nuclear export factor, putative n=1 Tax=Plasmodium chabaudi chabaudi TaxID=31271 RepID=A0A4V6M9S2_PLACU|nr:large ribosomal subunit nuclear export factor, putative [Plasmodium chabaudi chabaudi]VTZ70197.1 large ribosomal subunit nuclear export factor, putative [Plasmodium chabaudi chabaudi]|eukprot:XP_738668.2 large ribosomal subunit nuclear export factor, putative [Plasmodium chabaudi chabaudi]